MKKQLFFWMSVIMFVSILATTCLTAEQKKKGASEEAFEEEQEEVQKPVVIKKSSARPRMIEVEEEMWYRLNKDLLELQDELIKTKAKAKVDEAELDRLQTQLKECGKKRGRFQEVHRVQKNDSLWKIAKRYYNDPFKWRWIFKENIKQVTNPDRIYPEQVLDIPQY